MQIFASKTVPWKLTVHACTHVQKGGALAALKEMGHALKAVSTLGGSGAGKGKAFLQSVPTVS